MRRLLFIVIVLSLVPGALWAGYGKSNVMQKEIHRTPAVPEPSPVPAQTQPAQPAAAAVPEKSPEAVAEKKGCTKKVDYHYTIHILSSQELDAARSEMERMKSQLGTVFITRTNLGPSGIWYRVDYGIFTSAKDAVLKMKELQKKGVIDKGAFLGGSVPYTIELATFEAKDKDAALQEGEKLKKRGVFTYILEESGGCLRLVTGAFPEMKSANMVLSDLHRQGFEAKITKR